MATNTLTNVISTNSAFTLCLENYSRDIFFSPSDYWGHFISKTSPYIPVDNQNLINKCKKAYEDSSNESANFFIKLHKFNFINQSLNWLSPRDLANFSELSKCCYFATKTNLLWEMQFQKLFPNIKLMSRAESNFFPEQQFKIYFYEMHVTLNQYKDKFSKNNAILIRLIGENGNDGEIKKTRKKYEDCGGETTHTRFMQALNAASNEKEMQQVYNSNDARVHYTYQRLISLTKRAEGLVNKGHASIDNSIYLKAINMISNVFDDQQRFTQCIQKANNSKK